MIVARTVCHRIRQMDGLSIADRHYHGIQLYMYYKVMSLP